MSCRPDLHVNSRVVLLTTKPKQKLNSKKSLKINCSMESVVPLHQNLNCRPKALIKFDPPSPTWRLKDRGCETQKMRDGERRALEGRKRRKLTPLRKADDSCNNTTPPALDGRLHREVQTEVYLEELKEYREEKNTYCQTDAMLDRPPTPYFIPGKTGLDKETQIYDGDLFDFDLEVQPVLEVLVGKVVEQALIEAQEEEELASLREQQRIFEELRNAEFEEEQRLEEQERRIKEEKMKRLKQEISRQRQAKLLEKKISAVAYSRGYIGSLVSATFGELISENYFYDDKEKLIEILFRDEILDLTREHVEKEVLARRTVDLIIRELAQQRFNTYIKINSADFERAESVNSLRVGVRAESFDQASITPYFNVIPKTEEEVNAVVEQIKNIFFLKDMPRSHLTAIANGLSERMVSANETLFKKGDTGDEFYIIKSGQVEISSTDNKTYNNMDYFGEMALLYNQTRKTTAVAKTDGLLWFMKRSNFKRILNNSSNDAHSKWLAMFKKVKLFRNMSDKELDKAVDAIKTYNYSDGQVIFSQGEKADSLVIVESGKVKLITTSEMYPEGQVTYMDKETYFGELALISDIYRSATVVAVGDVTVLVLTKDAFERMVGSAYEIADRKKPV